MGIIQEGSMSFLRFTKLFVERINLLVLLKKNFSQKLDNSKNLCYNKYVRLRGKQTLHLMRIWWNADTPHSKCGGVIRAGSSPAIRTWQGRARNERCRAVSKNLQRGKW